jgi:Flp pilus assembly pilin Flp
VADSEGEKEVAVIGGGGPEARPLQKQRRATPGLLVADAPTSVLQPHHASGARALEYSELVALVPVALLHKLAWLREHLQEAGAATADRTASAGAEDIAQSLRKGQPTAAGCLAALDHAWLAPAVKLLASEAGTPSLSVAAALDAARFSF